MFNKVLTMGGCLNVVGVAGVKPTFLTGNPSKFTCYVGRFPPIHMLETCKNVIGINRSMLQLMLEVVSRDNEPFKI
jgi:hypothetical protein